MIVPPVVPSFVGAFCAVLSIETAKKVGRSWVHYAIALALGAIGAVVLMLPVEWVFSKLP